VEGKLMTGFAVSFCRAGLETDVQAARYTSQQFAQGSNEGTL